MPRAGRRARTGIASRSSARSTAWPALAAGCRLAPVEVEAVMLNSPLRRRKISEATEMATMTRASTTAMAAPRLYSPAAIAVL